MDGIGLVSLEVDLDYVAGFFDGEGCIGISKPKQKHIQKGYRLDAEASIRNTNRHALELIQHFLLTQGIDSNLVIHSLQTSRRKTSYALRISNLRSLSTFTELFKGKLRIKGRQLALLERFVQSREKRMLNLNPRNIEAYSYTPDEFELADAIRKLNKRGPPSDGSMSDTYERSEKTL